MSAGWGPRPKARQWENTGTREIIPSERLKSITAALLAFRVRPKRNMRS